MSRNTLRAAAVITVAALLTGTTVTTAFGATGSEEVSPPTPIDSPTGTYIVLLEEDPVATYDGGEPGLRATTPADGEKLDTQSAEVKEYAGYLQERQQDVAAETGVSPEATYQITLNGFSAKMSPQEAAKVAGAKGVVGVYPDEIRHPVAVPSTEFLGLEGAGGVWESLGGTDAAGEGVVVGVVDTGIAPEHPSFAGEPLSATPGDEPYLDGDDVVFAKANGDEFRATRVTGQDWGVEDYSTKLIGAQYFSTGAASAGFDFGSDYLSPRDGDGHGSHTASTAAGNAGVDASIEGIDFGAVSGVAPAAKVAAYKACYVGPDPLVTTDDICALSDLLDAIDTAVNDGVDVINYSIGGGAATTTWSPDDQVFFNAAVAGVFVSASAGNSGPDASTADHAAPWYTTVAASTIPTWEGTVSLPNGFLEAGASVTVPFGESLTAPVVYAGDIPAEGVSAADAALCYLDSLDPEAAAGAIVVCDRGVIARVEKSQAVAEAGGVGSILVNVTPASLDNDFHSVPTVHLPDTVREPLLDYVRNTPDAEATLIGENTTGEETPVPQIAGFSSRGPMLADGSDVIKPDIAAPGVAILAATQNGATEDPTFGILSGTSMAAPHVAGLAALYLTANPGATPDEVKSAMMTTASNTVNADGSANLDPFAQGAGQVEPTDFLDPGVLYLNGPVDWAGFVEGTGNWDFGGIDPIDPSDLNLASLAIGTLSKEQTVTRTLTATRPGTYTVEASIPGVDVSVSPASLTFGAAGEQQSFEVTISNADAPVEQWATGFMTWTGDDGTTARSPLAVRPVTADAPAEVSGTGIAGSTEVTIDSGVSGELPLNLSGLAPVELLTDPANPVEGHTGDENSGDADGNVFWFADVAEGTSLAQWTLDSSDDAGSDLDLIVYRVVSREDTRYYEQFVSATASADEQVSLIAPTAGTYLIVANMYSITQPLTWDLTQALVTPEGEGSLTATPNPLPVTRGEQATYALSWTGLQAETSYLGVVQYGESQVRTIVSVDAGAAAPEAVTAPEITGTAKVGRTLEVTPGEWDPADVELTYQWLRDGTAIEGATSTTYTVTRDDVGTALSARVTATAEGNANAGTALSNEVFVKVGSDTEVSMNRYIGTSKHDYTVTVEVTVDDGSVADGTVEVWVGSTKLTGTLADGAVSFDLPKQKKGIKVVIATYTGSDTVARSVGVSGFLVLR
ncbi:S8 family serine peptidase [Microbacterium sp. UBA1612]|uniref:S8 family serine peptidase n=1 Tax=Microbacterium sp. UBA1612 TaxID=1946942 RepID=UPI00257BEA06|nr:S8 family serine peptidase [Microbacterium sp. UBA1612]|tara:strand:- start:3954 stop:7535 length:3582 start_codon:yes stop_codon:yes gene_type:complete